MERDRCRQDETGQKLDVKKCDGIVRRFTKTGDRRGKIRDGYPCTPETCAKAVTDVGDLGLMGSSGQSPGWLSSTQAMPVVLSLHLGSVLSGDFSLRKIRQINKKKATNNLRSQKIGTHGPFFCFSQRCVSSLVELLHFHQNMRSSFR